VDRCHALKTKRYLIEKKSKNSILITTKKTRRRGTKKKEGDGVWQSSRVNFTSGGEKTRSGTETISNREFRREKPWVVNTILSVVATITLRKMNRKSSEERAEVLVHRGVAHTKIGVHF